MQGINGDKAATLDASYFKGCGERQGVEREVVCVEGNGSRPSHKGDGYRESDTMYTLNSVEQHAVCYSQDAYDKFTENEKSASLKACGGTYGGGQRVNSDTKSDRVANGKRISKTWDAGSHERNVCCSEKVGALCRSDFKGVGNQYVNDGKCIIQRIE